MVNTYVWHVFLYVSKTWILGVMERRKIEAFMYVSAGYTESVINNVRISMSAEANEKDS